MQSTITNAAEQATIGESSDYANHVKKANDSRDAGVIALLREVLAMLSEMIENQEAALEKVQARRNNDQEMR